MTTLAATDVVQRIYDNYEKQFNGEFRAHLGASMGGDPCMRKLYYNFRHAVIVNHDGRLLKLFQRGHKEEFTFTEELNRAGFRMITEDPEGNQFRLGTERNKHVSGSGDGFAEVLTTSDHFTQGSWVLVEMKTHNAASFKKLVKDGVLLSKPLHFSQMNLYMKWSQLTQALYIAVNKNTDELYVESIALDTNHSQQIEDRMVNVAEATSIPVKLHEDGSRFDCKFCDFHSICHTQKFALNVTCRNCVHVKPLSDGTWECGYHSKNLGGNFTSGSCQDHIIHPDFLAAIAVPIDSNPTENYIEFEFFNKLKLKTGTASDDVIDTETLAGIVTNGYEAIDENVIELIAKFDAKLGTL